MFVNWLSNNVLRFGAFLCSVGIMVPWLFSNRAMADPYTGKTLSNSTGYRYDSGDDAGHACIAWLEWTCSGQLSGIIARIYSNSSGIYKANCIGYCWYRDEDHRDHWHPEYVPGLPGNLAAVES